MLGLEPTATAEEARRAYRRLAAAYHPDAAGGDASRMAAINAAYDAIRKRGAVGARVASPPAAPPAAPAPAQPQAPQSLGCIFGAIAIAFVVIATLALTLVFTRPDDEPTAPRSAGPGTTASEGDGDDPPPWTGRRVPASSVPVAASVWQRSPAREQCPLLVPAAATSGTTARVVDVPGGWGVSWGRFGEPDEFGVSATPGPRVVDDPIATLRWTDGSVGELRPVGDRLVATVRITGTDCTYEIFSTGGFDPLADVLGSLRFVSQR